MLSKLNFLPVKSVNDFFFHLINEKVVIIIITVTIRMLCRSSFFCQLEARYTRIVVKAGPITMDKASRSSTVKGIFKNVKTVKLKNTLSKIKSIPRINYNPFFNLNLF